MKQRIIVTLLTVLVFGVGFIGGQWAERHRPLPPPPAALMAEFATPQPVDKNVQPAQNKAVQNAPQPYDRAQLVAEIEKLRPQIEAYRSRLEQIDREYEVEFVKILNPEQRRILEERMQKHRADLGSKEPVAAPQTPLSEEEISKLRDRPFQNAFWKVSFKGRLDGTVKDFKLDPEQAEALKQQLLIRREKFLALVDSLPPPTFRLAELAKEIQRLVDPSATSHGADPAALSK